MEGEIRSGNIDARADRIVVADDDPAIRQMIASYLEEHNLSVTAASSRGELLRHIQTNEPSMVVLDMKLGQDDGFDILRDIRASSNVPVIVITGHRPDEIDRIVGLELGADDYVLKPFSLRELLARIRAVLRRHEMGRTARAPERGGYRFEGWRLERRGRKLIDPSGDSVPLSRGEFALLLAFLEAPQRPLSREHLLQATRVHEDALDRSVDVQVLKLRRKLELDPSSPRLLRTERGVGYVFAARVQRF
jgi:two-component system, OmpR family, response regulator